MCFDYSNKAGKIYKMRVKMTHDEVLECKVETSKTNASHCIASHCILPYCFIVLFLDWRNTSR